MEDSLRGPKEDVKKNRLRGAVERARQRIQSPGEGEMENPERHRLEGQHSPFYYAPRLA